jgi:hypothetical protein
MYMVYYNYLTGVPIVGWQYYQTELRCVFQLFQREVFLTVP